MPPVSELKVTKERVLAAAAKCGDAANVLKELFPEAFDKPVALSGKLMRDGREIAAVRDSGEYAGKGFYITRWPHEWRIVKDKEGLQVIVPAL